MQVKISSEQYGCLKECVDLAGGSVDAHLAAAVDDYIRVVAAAFLKPEISQIEKEPPSLSNLLEFRKVASS